MKFNILLILLFGCLSSYAQFNKGDKYIGGTISANSYSSSPSSGAGGSPYTNTGWSLGPTVGFFLNSKTAYGFGLGYSYSRYYSGSGSNYTEDIAKSLDASIFLKQFFTISDNFYFTLTEDIYFTRGTQSTFQTSVFGTINIEKPNYSVGLGIRPSFVFFPSPKWGFEAGFGNLNYTYKRTLPNEGDVNNLSLNLTSYLNFGINYYFRKSE